MLDFKKSNNKEFENIVKIADKLFYKDEKLCEQIKEESSNLYAIDLFSLTLFFTFISLREYNVIANQILDFADNFYKKTEKYYNDTKNKKESLVNQRIRNRKKFNKVVNQLDYFSNER